MVFQMMWNCKTPVDLPFGSRRFISLDQRFLHKSLMDKHIFIPGLYWDGAWDSPFIHWSCSKGPLCDWTFCPLGPFEAPVDSQWWSIFSQVYLLSVVYLLWWGVSSDLLPIFLIKFFGLFPYCWVLRVLCIVWITVLYQMCLLQIFSLWHVF